MANVAAVGQGMHPSASASAAAVVAATGAVKVAGPLAFGGACVGGIREADLTLEWALTPKHELTQEGIRVVLTRSSNTDPIPLARAYFVVPPVTGCASGYRLLTLFIDEQPTPIQNMVHQESSGGLIQDTWAGRSDRGFLDVASRAYITGVGTVGQGVRTASALTSFSGLIFTSLNAADTQVQTSLNLVLTGDWLAQVTGPPSVGGGGSANLSVFVSLGGNIHTGSASIGTDGSGEASGLLANVPLVAGAFSVGITTPQMTLPVGQALTLEVSLVSEARAQGDFFGVREVTTQVLPTRLQFATNGPVFSNLSPDVTVNAPSLNLFDNQFLGAAAVAAPEPASLALCAVVLLPILASGIR